VREDQLEVKGWDYNTLARKIKSDLKTMMETDSSSALDQTSIIDIRVPFSRCNRAVLTFRDAPAAAAWLAEVRRVKTHHPFSWRAGVNDIFWTAMRPPIVKARNAVTWKAKCIAMEVLSPDDRDGLEVIWGRHALYIRDGRVLLGELERHSGAWKWDAKQITEFISAEMLDKLKAASADLAVRMRN
jgi:hypothetical protein